MTELPAPVAGTVPDPASPSLLDPASTGTVAPVVPVVAATPRGRRRRAVLALLAAFALLVLAAGGAAGGLLAWDAQYEGKILPGVHVGTVDLSGLDRAAAGAAISAAYPYGEGRLILRAPGRDLVVAYADAARRPDVDALVDEAMASGRSGGLLDRAVAELRQAMDGITIAPRLRLDPDALAAAVTAKLAALERAPVDATITMVDGTAVSTRARAGRTVDPAPHVVAAVGALGRTDAPAEVVLEVTPEALPPAVDDADVSLARWQAGRMAGDVVVTFRDREWTIPAATVRAWVRFETGADGRPRAAIDPSTIEASLRKPAKAARRDPVDAQFLRARGGRVVGVVASRDGRELDVEATVARIAAELEGRGAGSPAAPVTVATAKVPPRLTTEEARKTAPVMSRLGKWTTYFPISERNYWGANIWRPAELIDGTVLRPGERFDWWAAIWPVTPARGFGPGGFIRGSYTDPTGALGGGMCSSSTTLFNAAMRAGLQMGARVNHKYYISRYPLGLDATVSVSGSSRQTMSFWNDTDHPVVIRAYRIRKGSSGYVRYEIWGVSDGRTVAISRPSVGNVRKATTVVVPVDTLPTGVREQTEYPSNGMDVSVTRVVRNANGRVIHHDTWFSRYVLWNGRIEVGR